MKNCLFIILAFLLHQTFVVAQRNPDAEIEKIANSLAMQLKNKGVKMAAVADFTYQGQTNTRIGKYLADELSSKLTMQGHSMMNRDKVREGMAEQQAKQQEKSSKTAQPKSSNDTLSLVELFGLIGSGKALKGVDAIIYGDIEDWEDDLRVVIQMTKNNAKRENIGAATGNFTKTPQIRRMVEGTVAVAQPPVYESPTNPSSTSSFPSAPSGAKNVTHRHQNLTFEVIGCRQSGRDVECKLNVISSDRDKNISIHKSGTRIIDASNSHEFQVWEMALADSKGTGGHVDKSLVADIPVEASLRFTNVNQRIVTIAKMEVRFWGDNLSYFTIPLYNIPVQ